MAGIKKVTGIPTIDVEMAVFRFGAGVTKEEFAIDTASKVAVEPQTETEDAIKLIKGSSGKLLAQKPQTTTITGHQITMTDNVFVPQVVVLMQGGTYTENADGTAEYVPPVSGSKDKGQVFETDFYSAVYDEAGDIVKYQKITYPNCKGSPITVNMEDNVFFQPELVINSAPKGGQPPYVISWVKELPEIEEGTDTSPAQGGGEEGQSFSARTNNTSLAKVGKNEIEEF